MLGTFVSVYGCLFVYLCQPSDRVYCAVLSSSTPCDPYEDKRIRKMDEWFNLLFSIDRN